MLGSTFGAGRCWIWASTWAYSAAVKGLPSIGDRAAKIISIRNISSGVSSRGGKDKAFGV